NVGGDLPAAATADGLAQSGARITGVERPTRRVARRARRSRAGRARGLTAARTVATAAASTLRRGLGSAGAGTALRRVVPVAVRWGGVGVGQGVRTVGGESWVVACSDLVREARRDVGTGDLGQLLVAGLHQVDRQGRIAERVDLSLALAQQILAE